MRGHSGQADPETPGFSPDTLDVLIPDTLGFSPETLAGEQWKARRR